MAVTLSVACAGFSWLALQVSAIVEIAVEPVKPYDRIARVNTSEFELI